MRARSRKAATALFALALIAGGPVVRAQGRQDIIERLQSLAERGKIAELRKEADAFIRKRPSDPKTPLVMMARAEHESDPARAESLYRRVSGSRAPARLREEALSRLCASLYLRSRWSELAREAERGASLAGGGERYGLFTLLRVKAFIYLDDFGRARSLCNELTASCHDYEALSQGLLLLCYIERETTGYSRAYLAGLRDLVRGFPRSGSAPSAFYLLGRYYEHNRDFNRAHSAYLAVTESHPRAPESSYARRRMERLAAHNPSKVEFLPSDDAIRSAERIDLRPETPLPSAAGKRGVSFSVALGPLATREEARQIAGLIKGDFEPLRVVRVRSGFMLYAGAAGASRDALGIKIRLAEEFGLNGRVVRMVNDSERTYIYGD